jgi:NADP-dependent 3-hydroxy acid dehydrogenase YdfG
MSKASGIGQPGKPPIEMARIVLVSGAAGGIGRRLVARFVGLGDTVLAQDLSVAGLDYLLAECTGMPGRVNKVIADVTDASALADALGAVTAIHGTADVLIANAGGASAAV